MKIIKIFFFTKDIANKVSFINMLHNLAGKNNCKLIIEEIYTEKECIKQIIQNKNLPNLLIVENLISLVCRIRMHTSVNQLPIIALHNEYNLKKHYDYLEVGFINFMHFNPDNVWDLIQDTQQ